MNHAFQQIAESYQLFEQCMGQNIMSIEEAIIENLRVLPSEKQQEVLDFVEFLKAKSPPKVCRRSIKGLCADLGVRITEEDIAQARREMWGNFPKAATTLYLNLPLVTRDGKIQAFKEIKTIW